MSKLGRRLSSSRQPSKFIHPARSAPQFKVGLLKLTVSLLEFGGCFVNTLFQDDLLCLALSAHFSHLLDHAVELIRKQAEFIGSTRRDIHFQVTGFGTRHCSQKMADGTVNKLPKKQIVPQGH